MVVQEGRDLRVGPENNVATVSAIAAVWSAQWFEFLSAHRDTTPTTATGTQVQHNTVDEFSRHDDPFGVADHARRRAQSQR